MSIEFRYDGVLLDPERVRLPPNPGGVSGLPGAAFNGEVGTAGLTIEDPDGDLDLVGLHEFTVDETDCSKPRIFTGWLYGRTITRGSYRTGPGRVWVSDIVDQNFAWGLKCFRAASAKRPAETDIARMAFMIDSAPMAANPVHDNGFWNTTDNPTNFGDSDYVGQYPVELAVSVAGTSGKNFYAYWDDTADEISGYYDLINAANRTSTLRISNVIADQDAVTFYPTVDAEMQRNPERVNSGVLLNYRGAYVYRQRAQTITDFIDRDIVYRTDRIGREDTAVAVADQMLEAMSVEQDTIRCTIRVPSSQVNLAREGEWMDVKFTHLPGLDSGFTALPIIRRNVTPVPGRRDRYDLQLELSTKAPERGPGGGDPGEFPYVGCSEETGTLVQSGAFATGNAELVQPTLASPPTEGNLLTMAVEVQQASSASVPSGWTAAEPMVEDTDGHGFFLLYRTVVAGDPATWSIDMGGATSTGAWASLAEFQGPLSFVEADDHESAGDQTGTVTVDCGTVDATGHDQALVVGGGIAGDGHPGTFSPSFNVGTEIASIGTGGGNLNMAAWAFVAGATGSTNPVWTDTYPSGIAHGTAGITALFECVGGDTPPGSGVSVHRETIGSGDGTTTTFTTTFPYADGSLRVFIDDIDQTGAVVSFDGETGDFTLGFAPEVGEVIVVSYQGR